MKFEEIEILNQPAPTFFAKFAHDLVPMYLKNRGFNDFEIISKSEAMNRFGPDLKIPDVRLVPDAPRIERSVLCLVSRLNPAQAQHWIEEMFQSAEAQAYLAEKDARACKYLEEQNAMPAEW